MLPARLLVNKALLQLQKKLEVTSQVTYLFLWVACMLCVTCAVPLVLPHRALTGSKFPPPMNRTIQTENVFIDKLISF